MTGLRDRKKIYPQDHAREEILTLINENFLCLCFQHFTIVSSASRESVSASSHILLGDNMCV